MYKLCALAIQRFYRYAVWAPWIWFERYCHRRYNIVFLRLFACKFFQSFISRDAVVVFGKFLRRVVKVFVMKLCYRHLRFPPAWFFQVRFWWHLHPRASVAFPRTLCHNPCTKRQKIRRVSFFCIKKTQQTPLFTRCSTESNLAEKD